jgi:signal peptidase I
VIVFDSPLEKKSITHRVIAVTRSGIYTRGDNNRAPDPWRLKPKHITGRVDRIKKGKKTETIINGRAGMWLARFLYARNYAKRILYKVLRPVYRAINKVNFLPVLFHQIMAAKIVVFKKADHKELQLLLGKHVIGRKVVGKKWRVKLPYRLLINPRLLPK